MIKIKDENDLTGYGIAADDKQATLVAFSDYESTDIIIPAYANGVPVRKIGFAAFKGMDNLRVVKIPDTVKSIENSAFRNCSSLERVEIAPTLENIADYAFAGCKNLKSVTIPSGVRALPNHVFDKDYSLTDFIVWDCNKNDGSSKRFVVACGNEHRRFGFMQASLTYFESYSMRAYDMGFGVIREIDDQLNIAEYRLFEPEELSDYQRQVYENTIRMFIPLFLKEDRVHRLTAAGTLGIINENNIDKYLEMASQYKGGCMAYLLQLKEEKFQKHTLDFEL